MHFYIPLLVNCHLFLSPNLFAGNLLKKYFVVDNNFNFFTVENALSAFS